MDPDELRLLLWSLVDLLERGNWRAVVRPPEFGGREIAGPSYLVRWAVVVRLGAYSMRSQTQGEFVDAWNRLGEAAALLPPQLVRRDSPDAPRAVLRSLPPDTAPVDERLVVRIARLVAREQLELDDLRVRFAAGKMRARDELVESYIHFRMWVVDDPWACYRPLPGDPTWDPGPVDLSRTVMCDFGTGLRSFANPTGGGRLSQAPWQDIGGSRGLAAEALGRLAAWPAPAPWCGAPGTTGLVVRRGRLRSWQYARRWSEDRDASWTLVSGRRVPPESRPLEEPRVGILQVRRQGLTPNDGNPYQ